MFKWEEIEQNNSVGLNSQKVKLNPFTLRFPKVLEEDFLHNHNINSILQINISSVAAVILFSSFLLFDYFLVPELFFQFFLLRVVLGSAIIFSAMFIINKYIQLTQPVYSTAVILVGLINISFILAAYPKLNSYYYIGIILIYFWCYTFLRLRFTWASFAGTSIFLVYFLSVTFFIKLETELYFISLFYLFASNIAGMSISYAFEYYARRTFYQNLILEKTTTTNVNLYKKITESDKVIGVVEQQLMLQSQALGAAANSIIIFNLSGKIIWCNHAFLKLTGYSKNEVIGKTANILKSGKHDNVFYKNLWTSILNGRVWSGEIINKKKSGELYHEEMTITPVTNKLTHEITHFIAIKQNITQRKKMEDELFKSEKRLRNFVENATMGIYRTNIEGKVLLANDALVKMLGFSSVEELQNRNLSNAGYVNPSQREDFIKKLNETGNLIGFESEWQKADGSIIIIRESARLDYDEFNNPIFEGTVEDITINKLAELELRKSSERLQSVIDNVNDAIFIHDTEGNIIDINNKVLDLYNIGREEVVRLKIEDISSTENSFEKVNEYWTNVIAHNKTYKFEWKAKRPNDSSTFDVEVFIAKITLSNNDYILANVRDITEEKEANKKLLVTQKAIEMNSAPIYWITKRGEFVYVNQAAVEMLNYSKEELLSMKIYDVDKQWSKEFWNDFGYQMLEEKNLAQFESIHISKDGREIPIEVSASIINYENEELIIAIISDITERRKIAESLIEAKEKAEQSDKLKSDFLAGMSHEIRTPVNTILNFTSLIKNDLGEDISDEINDSFEMIESGSKRLIRTIDSIINMSQLQSGIFDLKTERIKLHDEILRPIFNEYKPVAQRKNLKLILKSNSVNDTFDADSYTINQLFINLIDNAIKYTNSGSVEIITDVDENHLTVKIKDTGIGISEEFLPTLFDPFVQEEMGYTRTFEGNGLGLALVKRYVELNNAEISVESKKGHGSTFTVKLKKINPSPRQKERFTVAKKDYLNSKVIP